MIGVLIILSLTSAALNYDYYLDNGVTKHFSEIPFHETNVFYTSGKYGQSFTFTLTMNKMDETPFDYLYYDTWKDSIYNATFSSYIYVEDYITTTDIIKINYEYTISTSDTNYIGFQFTPSFDLDNVDITISEHESDSGLALIYVLLFFIFAPCICCIIVVVLVVVIIAQCSKKSPPPQIQNNNPYQPNNLPQQPQYYPPQQPQYYPPSQPQILVQPQNPQINNSISDNSLDKINNK